MNKLNVLRNIEQEWRDLSFDQRAEFEARFGPWVKLRINDKDESLRRFLRELRQREEKEAKRREAELLAAERRLRDIERQEAAERRHRERLTAMQGSLQPINDGLRVLAAGIGEIRNQIGDIGRRQELGERQLADLGDRFERRQLAPAVAHAETPKAARETTVNTVYTMTPVIDDCRYVKDGPTGCIQVYQGSDGHTYGTCGIGDQVRRREWAPRVASSARDTTGCPSNGMFRVCDYLTFTKVRRS